MKKTNYNVENQIKELLKQNGVKIKNMTFVPIGEESYGYKVETQDQILFAKYSLNPDVNKGISIVNSLLLEVSDLPFVVPPKQINGTTEFDLPMGKLYFYPFIDGVVVNTPNENFSNKLLQEISGIMVQIHKRTPSIKTNVEKENFEDVWMQRFNNLPIKNVKDNWLETLYSKNMDKIKTVIEQHIDMGNKLKTTKLDFVLSHGDITGLNIIQTEAGLKLLDWDGVLMAPKERDLNFFLDVPNFPLRDYLFKTSYDSVNKDAAKYYGYRWAIESIIVNFQRLFNYREDFGEQKQLVKEIEYYISSF